MTVVNKHTKIISAAIKVFAKKGFFTARISDIAKEAKVADGTIYIYFNNKHDILLSIFEEEIGKIFDKTQNLISLEKDPCRMLEIYTNQYLRAMKRNKNLGEVIHIELRQTNKLIKNYRRTKLRGYLNIIADIIRKGQDQGIFRTDIIPDVAKRIYFGSLDEVTRVWNISLETHYTVDEVSHQMLTLFLSGIHQPTNSEN